MISATQLLVIGGGVGGGGPFVAGGSVFCQGFVANPLRQGGVVGGGDDDAYRDVQVSVVVEHREQARGKVRPGGEPAVGVALDDGVVAVRIDNGLVTGLYYVRNPDKLTRLCTETTLGRDRQAAARLSPHRLR
ncbi:MULTISPECIES: hypothetical protein [unclassified Nocardia]|uniref:hypothetical protein n=1 Tax=unclassified Nocardia TaxID=2637762 RepID=UPI001CE466CE|nr:MULTISPECIES: hypothetical protein [unclassified Nocardia]